MEDGLGVTFNEIDGMTELNGCEPRRVKFTGPFEIGDTSSYKTFLSRGNLLQVKKPKTNNNSNNQKVK